jgi:hypothetical protein
VKKRLEIEVDAARFIKRVGDQVRVGERLGEWQDQTVRAPISGRIESVIFDPGNHSLVVTVEGEVG